MLAVCSAALLLFPEVCPLAVFPEVLLALALQQFEVRCPIFLHFLQLMLFLNSQSAVLWLVRLQCLQRGGFPSVRRLASR
jgi:hypothetical protein